MASVSLYDLTIKVTNSAQRLRPGPGPVNDLTRLVTNLEESTKECRLFDAVLDLLDLDQQIDRSFSDLYGRQRRQWISQRSPMPDVPTEDFDAHGRLLSDVITLRNAMISTFVTNLEVCGAKNTPRKPRF